MAVKVLCVTCVVLAVIFCLYSLWLMEAHHEGYMADAFGLFYGSIGLLITLVFALTGIVLSTSWIRRNKATKESSSFMGWSLVVLVTCILLFLFALPWLVLRGDLS